MIGDYALRLRKELYQPAEVTMRVPTGDRVAEGEIVMLEVDPKYSESAMFFEAVRKLSEKVDFPGIDSEATLRDVLERLADRYKLDLMVNEAALREAGQGNWSQQKLGKPLPKLHQVSLQLRKRKVDRPVSREFTPSGFRRTGPAPPSRGAADGDAGEMTLVGWGEASNSRAGGCLIPVSPGLVDYFR